MNSLKLLKKIVIVAGIYSIIGGFPLAVPAFFKGYYEILNMMSMAVGFGGGMLVAPTDGTSMLLINTAGLLMVSMGFLLLYGARDLEERSGIPVIIACARILFSMLVVYYSIIGTLSRIWIVDAIIDSMLSIIILICIIKGSITLNGRKSAV